MSRYAGGANVERELIHFLLDKGFACIRAAGSGKTSYPSPDVFAGKKGKKFAIEVKSSKKEVIYIERNEIEELVKWASIAGCKPIVAVKFKNKGWKFFSEFKKASEKFYSFSFKNGKETFDQ